MADNPTNAGIRNPMNGGVASEKPHRALVKPEMLRWARESTHLDLGTAAKAAGIKNPDKLAAAEQGADSITLRQLEKLAKACRLPLKLLYLSEPPAEGAMPVDFRAGAHGPEPFDSDIIRTLRRARERRDAALELFDELGVPRKHLPPVSSERDIIEQLIPLVCVRTWKVTPAQMEGTKALNATKEVIEQNLPVLIFEAQLTSARGCSLFDDRLSIIILSSSDYPNAKRFTLVHELAHILRRDSGICTPFSATPSDEVEARCNIIAGESLAPKALLEPELDALNERSDEARIDWIVRRYSLSYSAAAVRLHQLGRLDRKRLATLLDFYQSQWQQKRKHDSEGEGGPHAHLVQVHRLGPSFTRSVLDAMREGALSITQATGLLGVSPSYESVNSIREKLLTVYGG